MAEAAHTAVPQSPPVASGSRGTILVVEDDAAMRTMLREALEEDGFVVETAPGGRAGVERVRQGGVDLVVSDVKMPDLDGLDMLREIKATSPSPHVITITAFGSIDTAIRAVKLGAFDYITKPFDVDQLILSVQKALAERELRSELARLRDEVQRSYRFSNIVGKSAPMQEVFANIRRLAGSSASVLVTGASGTGKELVAKAVHFNSPRRERPFVAINCAAIPDALLESELFGYKRGAFTDARSDRAGIFVEAQGGTIFLDEIAELSPALQAKLLRVLQEGEIRPLGATRSEKIDVRVIAATNKDLEARLGSGAFREDLYYRLVLHIHLPALRDRPEDILPLAEHFVRARSHGLARLGDVLHPGVLEALAGYSWPGNVRELETMIERAVVLGEKFVFEPERDCRVRTPGLVTATGLEDGLMSLAEAETRHIAKVLRSTGGRIAGPNGAARILGLHPNTLRSLMIRLNFHQRAGI